MNSFLLLLAVLVQTTLCVWGATPESNVAVNPEQTSAVSPESTLKRLLSRKQKQASLPDVCSKFPTYSGSMQKCLRQASQTRSPKRTAECTKLDGNREGCLANDLCTWIQNSGTCVENLCNRLNNGRCTLQATGNRCVWYTKTQNRRINNQNRAGCYTSPCTNKLKSECGGAGNDVYSCVWCGKWKRNTISGCQPAQATSTAGVTTGCESPYCECLQDMLL